MFILTGSLKEKVVTAGVLIACFVLVAFSIQVVRVNGSPALIFPLGSILIIIAIYKGMRVGYGVARFIFGLLAIGFVGGAINPFAYMDIAAARGSFLSWVLGALIVAIVAAFSFYCLGEHEGLRMSSSEEKEKIRARRRRTNLQVACIILVVGIAGFFGVMAASQALRTAVVR